MKDVSLDLSAGRCLAIVGESGSGKSVTARTLVGLPGRNAIVDAEPRWKSQAQDALALSERSWRQVRGKDIGFILQDALVSLDPLRPVGKEIEEALRLHGWGNAASAPAKAIELLDSVGVPQPELRARQRPDELSGGLRQRALIASAIALDPALVIADEPTTALDVTVQAQILDLLAAMKDRGTGIILISHDLSVVSRLADDVAVMRGGAIVEQGPAQRGPGQPAARIHPGAAGRGALGAHQGHPADQGRGARASPPPATGSGRVRAADAGPGACRRSDLGKSYTGPDGIRAHGGPRRVLQPGRGGDPGHCRGIGIGKEHHGQAGPGHAGTGRRGSAARRASHGRRLAPASGARGAAGSPWCTRTR